METEPIIKTTQGLSFTANSEMSILDAAESQNIHLKHSCKNGQCGVCKTTLLEGGVIVLQEQIFLTNEDKANNKILTCCCAAKNNILIDAEDLTALKTITIKTLPARIAKLEHKTQNTIEVVLKLPPTAHFDFLEGQFIDVIGPEGIRRSYSIANSNNEKLITLFIKRVEGGVLSKYWFQQAKENDLLRIEGPKGSFFLRETKAHIILLATGTGIAPIKSILDKLNIESDSSQISVYWGNRVPEDFFWQPEYKNLNIQYSPVLSRNHRRWKGKLGYVQNIAIAEHKILDSTQVYACGSFEMIESARDIFIKQGLKEKHFHSDAFVSS